MNNIAQKKANGYPGRQLVDRSRMMSAPRGIPSRGTVQRAQEAPNPIRWFLQDIPNDVEQTLKTMAGSLPKFKQLCQKITDMYGSINVRALPPEQVEGGGAHCVKGLVTVNKSVSHDRMVDLIVFELHNALHHTLLVNANKNKDWKGIEFIEYQGAKLQAEIMSDALENKYVKKSDYVNKVANEWSTFDKYLETQKNHSQRYKDRFQK